NIEPLVLGVGRWAVAALVLDPLGPIRRSFPVLVVVLLPAARVLQRGRLPIPVAVLRIRAAQHLQVLRAVQATLPCVLRIVFSSRKLQKQTHTTFRTSFVTREPLRGSRELPPNPQPMTEKHGLFLLPGHLATPMTEHELLAAHPASDPIGPCRTVQYDDWSDRPSSTPWDSVTACDEALAQDMMDVGWTDSGNPEGYLIRESEEERDSDPEVSTTRTDRTTRHNPKKRAPPPCHSFPSLTHRTSQVPDEALTAHRLQVAQRTGVGLQDSRALVGDVVVPECSLCFVAPMASILKDVMEIRGRVREG
ncbi:hypothetical protein Z043_123633, partial [Scleropages formosus]